MADVGARFCVISSAALALMPVTFPSLPLTHEHQSLVTYNKYTYSCITIIHGKRSIEKSKLSSEY